MQTLVTMSTSSIPEMAEAFLSYAAANRSNNNNNNNKSDDDDRAGMKAMYANHHIPKFLALEEEPECQRNAGLLQVIRDGVAANQRKAQQRRNEKALVMNHCMIPKVLQTLVAAYL